MACDTVRTPRVEDGITRKSKKCYRIPLQGSLSSRNSRQKFETRRSWDLQRQRPLLIDDAWENLVQIIQERAGPSLHQGAPRPTLPLALERRRLLLKLGTARRLTGSSADQTPVENAKIEVSRLEKQRRRLSRWPLRKRRANWLEELEEGIRKQDDFLQIRTSPRWHRNRVETPSFWTNSGLHPFSD